MKIATLLHYQFSKKPIKIVTNNDIVIMSFNIRCISKKDVGKKDYRYRLPLIRKLIEEENPDVIGFQEVRVRQFKYLLKILKGYSYVYQKRDSKPDGEANPVFFKDERFECMTKNTFWLSASYKVMSNTFNSDCYRICSYVRLKDKISEKDFYVFNTHLDHINEVARIKGIALIKYLIKSYNVNSPTIIMGDMNDFYKSETIIELFNGHKDASKFNHQENIETFHGYGKEKEKIDYIAYSKGIDILDYKVVTTTYDGVYPSDHYPIEVKIKI